MVLESGCLWLYGLCLWLTCDFCWGYNNSVSLPSFSTICPMLSSIPYRLALNGCKEYHRWFQIYVITVVTLEKKHVFKYVVCKPMEVSGLTWLMFIILKTVYGDQWDGAVKLSRPVLHVLLYRHGQDEAIIQTLVISMTVSDLWRNKTLNKTPPRLMAVVRKINMQLAQLVSSL